MPVEFFVALCSSLDDVGTVPIASPTCVTARGEGATVAGEQRERVYLDARRHGIVLAPALLRAFALAAAGGFLVSAPFPLPLLGAVLVGGAALLALRAVWQWERTHVLVTDEQLALVRGPLPRRTAAGRPPRTRPGQGGRAAPGRLARAS